MTRKSPRPRIRLWKSVLTFIGCCLTSVVLSAQDRHIGPVTGIAVSGKRVFSVSQGGVYENHGAQLKRLIQAPFRVTSLAVAGDRLMLGGGDPGLSGVLALYDLSSGEIRTLKVADDLIYDVAVHATGELGAFACADGWVMTVDLSEWSTTALRKRHRHTAAARAVAFSPDGLYLASGGLDALVMISRTEGEAEAIQLQDHSSKVDCLAFSPDSKLLASGARDGKVRIHNMDGRLVRTYRGLAKDAQYIAWGANPYIWGLAWGGVLPTLAVGTAKGSLYRLSATDDRWTKLPETLKNPIYSLAFNRQGALIIGAHDVSLRRFVAP